MFLKEFEIRWNDLDANRHLANSAYVVYMSHTRMSFFTEYGLSLPVLVKNNLGPVVFHEHMHYYKEAQSGKVKVSCALGGLSEDGMFFRFIHNMYDEAGRNLAFSEVQGGFIDLEKRTLISLPDNLNEQWQKALKTEDFKLLSKADMRTPGRAPKHL